MVKRYRREQCVQGNNFRRVKQRNNAALQKAGIGEVILLKPDASKGMTRSVDLNVSSKIATSCSDAKIARLLYREG